MAAMVAHLALSLYVVVRLYDMQGVPNDTLAAARNTAARIMRDADINVRWAQCPCTKPAGPVELMIRVAAASEDAHAASLGFSYVDIQRRVGTLATVFADRVHTLASAARTDEGELLGRAIAHEMAHLLLGTHDHARNGLLRGTWTAVELGRKQPLDWIFSRDDGDRIRAALLRRVNDVRRERWQLARAETGATAVR